MGMRAVLSINNEQHFYAQWGSLPWQVSQWAAWLQACRTTLTLPTAENYAGVLGALGGGAILEPCEADRRKQGDLDWLYDVRVSGEDEAWRVAFIARGPRLWMDGDHAPVATLTATPDNLGDLEAEAHRAARQLARRAPREVERQAHTRHAEVLAPLLRECEACGAPHGHDCTPACLGLED